MCAPISFFLLASTVFAQASAQGSARVFTLEGIRVSNTLWLRPNGVFKHVIRQVESGPHPHLTIAFGTWKRAGGVLTTKSEGSDWNLNRSGRWIRQLQFFKTWQNPLAGDRRFTVVETERTLVLKDQAFADKVKGTFVLRKLDKASAQTMPSEKMFRGRRSIGGVEVAP